MSEPAAAEQPSRAAHEPASADETGEATDAVMAALWSRALVAWEDDKVHLALLEHAMRSEALPDLAGRYRAVLERSEKSAVPYRAADDEDDARAAIAKKRLDAIVVAATQMLFAMKSPPRQGLPRSISFSIAGICAFVVALVAYVIARHH